MGSRAELGVFLRSFHMTEPTPYTAPPAGSVPRTNTLAIIALIAAFVFAPVGIILGVIAQKQIKQSGEAGAGLAKAGLILGIVFTIAWIIFWIIYIVAIASLTTLGGITTY